MTIDDFIQQRNNIQLMAEPGNSHNKVANRKDAEQFAQRIWAELGVANRHIERVLDGAFKLPQVEREITACLERVRRKLVNNEF